MDVKEQLNPDPQTLILEWLKTANQFWAKPAPERNDPAGERKQGRVIQDSLLSIMRSLGAVSTAMSEPSSLESLYKSLALLPDISATILESGARSFLSVQQQVMEKTARMGTRFEPYSFDNLDIETIRAWSSIYENDIRQFINIPQLGLARLHQEKINKTIDKYTVFMASLASFIHLLELPFEKTAKVMHDRIEELAKSGSLPEDPREYYTMWVKVLEGHFMTLFKSSEYTKIMAETLLSMADFLNARNSIIQDVLQALAIPTNKEMDELYREIYILKKKVRGMEKRSGKK